MATMRIATATSMPNRYPIFTGVFINDRRMNIVVWKMIIITWKLAATTIRIYM